MQPQKIALVSKLKVEKNYWLWKKNHEDTREPLNSSKPNLWMPLTWSFHLMENADNILVSTKEKPVFIQFFFPLLQPFRSTFNSRIFFAHFSQKTKIQAPSSELSEGNVKLFSSQFLFWEELGTSWARRWCEGRTWSCSWLPGFGWLMGLG